MRDLEQRIEKLELERPAFLAELNNMFEACEEVLGRAESKRARVAAAESKRKQREETPHEPDPAEMTRDEWKAQLRSRRPSWSAP